MDIRHCRSHAQPCCSQADLSLRDGPYRSAAATAAYTKLLDAGEIKETDSAVLFNTGSGLKYTDTIARAIHLRRPQALPTSLPVGGIITPV